MLAEANVTPEIIGGFAGLMAIVYLLIRDTCPRVFKYVTGRKEAEESRKRTELERLVDVAATVDARLNESMRRHDECEDDRRELHQANAKSEIQLALLQHEVDALKNKTSGL